MSRKAHVTFLGEGAAATSPPYPTESVISSPPVLKTVGNGDHVIKRTHVKHSFHRTNVKGDLAFGIRNNILSQVTFFADKVC